VAIVGCGNNRTYIPPPPRYVFALPAKQSVWLDHVQRGFIAGCEQLQMECISVKYANGNADAIVKAVLDQGDAKGAPATIVFEDAALIKPVTDALSLKSKQAILVGLDDSAAHRLGHVGPDAKRLAALVAIRSQVLEPRATRILYVLGDTPTDPKMLEASAFRESDGWRKYRPRVKSSADVTDADFAWCDLVVPLGEDAQAKAIASSARRIIPTEPTEASLSLLKSGRAKYVIAQNYFDIGLRASRIAREQAVYKSIGNPILPISPKEVDASSVELYLETRFKVPAIIREKPRERPNARSK
jgi:hypothetical protein